MIVIDITYHRSGRTESLYNVYYMDIDYTFDERGVMTAEYPAISGYNEQGEVRTYVAYPSDIVTIRTDNESDDEAESFMVNSYYDGNKKLYARLEFIVSMNNN